MTLKLSESAMPNTRFTVTYKLGDIEPIEAEGYVIDGEAQVLLNISRDIAALFDINSMQVWALRSPDYELPNNTDA